MRKKLNFLTAFNGSNWWTVQYAEIANSENGSMNRDKRLELILLLPAIYYVQTTMKKEIAKNLVKNDKTLINHYTLFIVCSTIHAYCIAGDELLTSHEKFI